MSSRFLVGAVPAGVLAVLLAGCSSVPREAGASVKGKVVLPNGKPLTTGLVIFHPDAKKKNLSKHEARGKLNDQGEYSLTSDDPEQKGVPPGWYRVAIVAGSNPPKDAKDAKNEYAVPKLLIAERYASWQNSGLTFEVKPNAPAGYYDIKLVQ
jgi:hypothetical protein